VLRPSLCIRGDTVSLGGIIHSIQRLRTTARQAGSQERFKRSNSLLRFLVLAAQLAPVNMAERALPGRMERC
jgi:hypothetical protein